MTSSTVRVAVRAIVPPLLAGLWLAACGGGSATAPTPTLKTIKADGSQSGYIWTGPGVTAMPFVTNPIVGDLDFTVHPDAGFRGLVGFSLASVPPGSHVLQAALTMTICAGAGSPITKLGNLVVDHVSFAVPFDTLTYASGTLTSDIGTLATDNLGKKSMDITASVANDVAAGRPNSQFRLRMATLDFNADNVDDYVVFPTDSLHATVCPYDASEESTLTVAFTP